jgi:hypothetical protein
MKFGLQNTAILYWGVFLYRIAILTPKVNFSIICQSNRMICTTCNLSNSYIRQTTHQYGSGHQILMIHDTKLSLQSVSPCINLTQLRFFDSDTDALRFLMDLCFVLRWCLYTFLDDCLDIALLNSLIYQLLSLNCLDLFEILLEHGFIDPVDGLLHLSHWSVLFVLSYRSEGSHYEIEVVAHV